MSNLSYLRPNYNQVIATTDDAVSVSFNDTMNKFIDELITEIDSTPRGDLSIAMGDRISGDGAITFGSRV